MIDFTEIALSEIRKEIFGGIIYFPSRNVQLAINEDLYNLIKLSKKGQTKTDIIEKISQTYSVKKESAIDILANCLKILTENIESYSDNQDNISDWKTTSEENEVIRLSAPLMLIIEVTSDCNQHCKFCYQGDDEVEIKELPKDLLYRVVNEAREIGVFKIQYMGGEPLCRNDFIEILSYTSNKKGLFTSFTTNGVLINEQHINQLTKIEKLLPIQISIHGSSTKFTAAYEIKDNEWSKSISNCRLLKKYKIDFGIKTVISRLNHKDILESIRMFNELGAKSVTLLHFLPIGRGKSMEKESKFNKNEVEEIIYQVNSAKKEFPNIHIDYRPFLNVYFPRKPRTKLDNLVNCPSGNLDLRIRYDGKVIQCSSLRKVIDDLEKDNLKNVWHSISSKIVPCPYEKNKIFQCIQNY